MLDLSYQLYDIDLRADNRIKKILKEAKYKVAKYFGIPEYLLNLKYNVTKLPEIYEIRIESIGKYFVSGIRKIGKVFGIFDHISDTIYIDPINLYNEEMLRETIFHEVIHAAQKVLGRIYKLPRYLIEKEAHALAKILAKINI
jgi:hypothetical protein